jgi:feruloyl esterase
VFSATEIRVNGAAAAFLLFVELLVPSLAEATTISACKGLSQLSFGSEAKILSALPVNVSADDNNLSWLPARYQDSVRSVPPFCRVVAVSTPSEQSRIGVEVWLPLSGWNGRFLGTGSGGYPLTIEYRALIEGVQKGFAVANTDLGLAAHVAELPPDQAAPGDVTTLFINHPVRMVDFGSRATHQMTLLAQQLTARFYGRSAEWSYFAGCSTGGMQALREVEQYPEDYNGVLAGDPGENRARVHLSILWDYMTVWHRPDRILSNIQLEAMHSAAISACNGTSKAPFLNAPLKCTWRPESLLCGSIGGVCLTPDQVEAANLIYQGPRNPRTGEQYYPGLVRGSELGWEMYMNQASHELPFRGVFAFALGERFQFETFDWDRDAETFIDAVGPYLDATNTDMTVFQQRGGKLLLYHGGSDPLASMEDTVNFFTKAGGEGDPKTGSPYALLFVLPGMDHCQGGLGPDHFDRMSAIMRWAEHGIAPIPLTVWKQEANGAGTRHLCPYIPDTAGRASRKQSRLQECHEDAVP